VSPAPSPPCPHEQRIAQKVRIFARQKGKCLARGHGARIRELERHHVRPRSCHGSDGDSNICLICPLCHRVAHNEAAKIREKVLKVIFVAFGKPAAERSRLYGMYRKFSHDGIKPALELARIYPVTRDEYARWEDDGGCLRFARQ
jgi:hypothetical protein